MTEAFKFGPQWIRDLSNGPTSSSSGAVTPTATTPVNFLKVKLAEHRYGREEMLALFSGGAPVPADLAGFLGLVRDKPADPVSFSPLSEEEQRLLGSSVNSSVSLRLTNRGGGPPVRGRGGRGRGRGGRTDSYSRGGYDNYEEDDNYQRAYGRAGGYNRDGDRYHRDHDSRDPRGFGRDDDGGRLYSDSGPGRGFGSERAFGGQRGWTDRDGRSGPPDGREGSRTGDDDKGPRPRPLSLGSIDDSPGSRALRDNNWRKTPQGPPDNSTSSWRTPVTPGRERGFLATSPGQTPRDTGWPEQSFDSNSSVSSKFNKDSVSEPPKEQLHESTDNLQHHREKPPATSDSTASQKPGLTTVEAVKASTVVSTSGQVSSAATVDSSVPRTHSFAPASTAPSHTAPLESQLADVHLSSSVRDAFNSVPVTAQSKPGLAPLPDPGQPFGASKGSDRRREERSQQDGDDEFSHFQLSAEHLVASFALDEDDAHPEPSQQPPAENSQRRMSGLLEGADIASVNNAWHQPMGSPGGVIRPSMTASPRDVPSAPISTGVQDKWFYRDPQGDVQGPFTSAEMLDWFSGGYFTMNLLVRRSCDMLFQPLGDLFKTWHRIPFTPGPAPPPLVNSSWNPLGATSAAPIPVPVQQPPLSQIIGLPGTSPVATESVWTLLASASSPGAVQPGGWPASAGKGWGIGIGAASPPVDHHLLQQFQQQQQDAARHQEAAVIQQQQHQQQQQQLEQQRQEEERQRQEEDRRRQEAEAERQRQQQELERRQQDLERKQELERMEQERRRLAAERQQLETERLRQEAERRQREEAQRQEEEERQKLESQRREEVRLQQRREQERQRELEQQRELERQQAEEEKKRQQHELIKQKQQQEEQLKAKKRQQQAQQQAALQKLQQQQLQHQRQQQQQQQQHTPAESPWQSSSSDSSAARKPVPAASPAPANWAAKAPSHGGTSLAAIQQQQAEMEKKRQREHMMAIQRQQQEQQQQQQAKAGWASAVQSNSNGSASASSFRAIQAEQSRQKQAAKVKSAATVVASMPAPRNTSGQAWSTPAAASATPKASSSWGPPVSATVPSTAPSSGGSGQSFWDDCALDLKAPSVPAAKTSSSSKKATKQDDTLWRHFQQPQANSVFMQWCSQSLGKFQADVDVPTFVNFLLEVDSPYEVHDYIRSYLGNSKEAEDFGRQFIERRRGQKPVPASSASSQPSTSSMSSSSSAAWTQVTSQRKGSQSAAHTSTNSTSSAQSSSVDSSQSRRRKKKMQKVDASALLGFTVNPADRPNQGEIETLDSF